MVQGGGGGGGEALGFHVPEAGHIPCNNFPDDKTFSVKILMATFTFFFFLEW